MDFKRARQLQQVVRGELAGPLCPLPALNYAAFLSYFARLRPRVDVVQALIKAEQTRLQNDFTESTPTEVSFSRLHSLEGQLLTAFIVQDDLQVFRHAFCPPKVVHRPAAWWNARLLFEGDCIVDHVPAWAALGIRRPLVPHGQTQLWVDVYSDEDQQIHTVRATQVRAPPAAFQAFVSAAIRKQTAAHKPPPTLAQQWKPFIVETTATQ